MHPETCGFLRGHGWNHLGFKNSRKGKEILRFSTGQIIAGCQLFDPFVYSFPVTAGPPSFMRVRLGEHNLRKHDGPEQMRLVAQIIPHPGYEARTHRHDIMLLRLLQPARLSPQVRPVPLPTRCPFPGEDCVVSGWGLLSDNKPGTTGSHKPQGAWKDGAGSRNPSNTVLQGSWVEAQGPKERLYSKPSVFLSETPGYVALCQHQHYLRGILQQGLPWSSVAHHGVCWCRGRWHGLL